MDVEVTEEKDSGRLPEPGELWKHKDKKHVYMRVSSTDGEALREATNAKEDEFISVFLGEGTYRRTGRLMHTHERFADSIIILEQQEPLKVKEA